MKHNPPNLLKIPEIRQPVTTHPLPSLYSKLRLTVNNLKYINVSSDISAPVHPFNSSLSQISKEGFLLSIFFSC